VQRPGSYELIDTRDLAELVGLAGGLRSSVAKSLPIRVTRHDSHQLAAYTYVPFGTDGTLPRFDLLDEDSVVVRGTDELQRTILVTGAVQGADKVDAAAFSKRIPYIEGDTVRTVLERAGGLTVAGDMSRAYIERPQPSGEPVRITLDLEALLMRRDFTHDQPIHVGDQIVILNAHRSVIVDGAVAHAGAYEFNPQFGITEYIARAGGPSRAARDLTAVKVIRPSGTIVPYRSGEVVAPGDTIVVPERTFSRPEIVQISVAAATLALSALWIGYSISRGN
jgi:protein involved in polysaccharide export with SLBB domain